MAEQVTAVLCVIALVVVSVLIFLEKKKVIDYFDQDKNGKAH